MNKLFEVEKEILASVKKEWPSFKQGDIIKVFYKIKDKAKERIHPIEGIVIKVQGHLHRKSFTIRRISYGQAYEVSFPYYSPLITEIRIVAHAKRKPRRRRLYYLRGRVGRKAMLV